MIYRYILIDGPTAGAPSPNFQDPNTLRKHLSLYTTNNDISTGVLIETEDGSIFFDDYNKLDKYLDIVAP